MKRVYWVSLLASLLVFPALANAALFNYTGLNFEIYRLDGSSPTVAASGSITGGLTVADSYIDASYLSTQNLYNNFNVTLTTTLTFATNPQRTYTFTSTGMTGADTNFIQLYQGNITGWNFLFSIIEGGTRTYILTNGSTSRIVEGSAYYTLSSMDTIAGGWYNEKWIPTNQWTQTSSTVPVPAGAWLLGSGLLGLAGIRRKFRK